ncbi:MAG: cytochrome c [Deltaproteobacteria bacterium]|nr:cytochrome c [Deltaproteobacteria bacterium]
MTFLSQGWIRFGAPTASALVMLALGCGGEPSEATPSASIAGYRIVAREGGPLQAQVGDALALAVRVELSDGTEQPLPEGATIAWSAPMTVNALAPDADGAPLPAAFFLANAQRADHADDLSGVLFVVGVGKPSDAVTVNARLGGSASGTVSATVSILPMPTGDVARGQLLYGAQGFDCARCHGDEAQGAALSPAVLPGPPLDAAAGGLASDPDWNAALLAMAVRADMDNAGVVLRPPMPDYLGRGFTAQDAADVYAFLRTQGL